MRASTLPGRSAIVATRTTVSRTRPSIGQTVSRRTRRPTLCASGERSPQVERLLQPADLDHARTVSRHSCACMRSPRAIAHWLLTHGQPAIEPTALALDREEASLWSSTLTGKLRLEHTAVDGTCSLRLCYADGRTIAIAMDELRLAATAAV